MSTKLIELLEDWIASPTHDSAQAVSAALACEVDAVRPLSIVLRASHRLSPRWMNIAPSEAPSLIANAGQAAGAIAALLSMHRSGYVREIVLPDLSGSTHAVSLTCIALRLDDVVPSIATSAQSLLRSHFVPQRTHELVRLIPLLESLAVRQRVRQSDTLRSLRSFLLEHGLSALEIAARAPAFALRRAALAWLVQGARDAHALAGYLRLALEDTDARLVRWGAFQIAGPRTPESVQSAWLPALDAHRDPLVRRRALQLRAARRETAFVARAVLDVRADVRVQARKKYRGAALELYRSALTSPTETRTTLGALAGLGEVGSASHASIALAYVASPNARIAAEAIRCIGLLDAEGHFDLLSRFAMHGQSRSIRLEARRALERIEHLRRRLGVP